MQLLLAKLLFDSKPVLVDEVRVVSLLLVFEIDETVLGSVLDWNIERVLRLEVGKDREVALRCHNTTTLVLLANHTHATILLERYDVGVLWSLVWHDLILVDVTRQVAHRAL